jgi:O-antigen/teichoic acid export membrane protein
MGLLDALLQRPREIRPVPGAAAGSMMLGSLAVSTAQLVVGVLWALTSLYLVRSLSTHEYGRLAFGLYVYTLLQAVAGLGLGTAVMAEVARGRASNGVSWPTVHALLWGRLLSTIPVLLVGFGWAAASGNVLPAMAGVIACLGIVAEFLINVLAGGFRIRAYAATIIAQPATFLVLLVVLHFGTAEVVLIGLGSALALSLLLGIGFLGLRGSRRMGRPRVTVDMLGHAIAVARNAYLIYTLNIGFVSLPIILLGATGRYAEAAALSIVMTLVRFAPEALGLAVISSYFPRLKALDVDGGEARALFGTFARLLAAIAIPAALGLAILGRPVLAVLFSGAYDGLAPYLAIGSVLVVLLPIESLLAWTLVGRNDGRTSILALALRLLVVLVACFAFVVSGDLDSVLVVLIGSVAGVLMSLAIQGLRTYRHARLSLPAREVAIYAFVAGLAYVGLRAVMPGDASNLVIVIAAGLATVPVLGLGALILRPQVPARPGP